MRISSYLFRPRWIGRQTPVRFCTLVGSFFLFGVSVILMLVFCGAASADEDSIDVKPYGIDRRIPWETSRVVGAPDAPDDLSTLAREQERFVEAGKTIFNGKGSCYSCHILNPSAPPGRGTGSHRYWGARCNPKTGDGSKGVSDRVPL